MYFRARHGGCQAPPAAHPLHGSAPLPHIRAPPASASPSHGERRRIDLHPGNPTMNTGGDPPHDRRPPPAPVVRRRVRLKRAQWIGLPFLMAVPLIALTGVLGDWEATGETRGGAIRIRVEHPTVQRAGQRREIRIVVQNVSAAPVDGVLVELAPHYLAAFGEIHFHPPPDRAFRLLIPRLQPGETRPAHVEMVAVRPGTSRGEVTVSSRAAGESLAVPLRTFVFP